MINFKTFCSELLPLFVNSHYFDKKMLKDYFNDYQKLCTLPTYDTVERFAKNYFQDWKPETHEVWLKSEKEKRNDRKPVKEKKLYKIPKFTKKRQSIEREYEKVKAEILEERPHRCAGCHRTDCRLTFSHRIPRNERKDLIAEKSNIDLMCDETGDNCHNKVETFRWNELINGAEIADYIKRMQPERYWIFFYKNKAV